MNMEIRGLINKLDEKILQENGVKSISIIDEFGGIPRLIIKYQNGEELNVDGEIAIIEVLGDIVTDEEIDLDEFKKQLDNNCKMDCLVYSLYKKHNELNLIYECLDSKFNEKNNIKHTHLEIDMKTTPVVSIMFNNGDEVQCRGYDACIHLLKSYM